MSEQAPAAMDPYEIYRLLREEQPVARDGDGPFQVARYEDVREVLRDNETFSSQVAIRPPEERRAPSMLFSDPPIHNRLRKLVSRAFSPTRIALQREMVTRRCEQLVIEMARESQTDLITALAAPLPVTVIADMLGVADGDMNEFKYWSDTIFGNIAEVLFGEPIEEVTKAAAAMDSYFLERIEGLRAAPADYLLGQLVHTETDEGMLTNEELLSFCRLFLIAGNETTTGLISASVRVFHEMPDTFARIKENPELAIPFVEETLRFYSPFSATVRRTTRDVEVAGVIIAAGELVIPLIASANRDESMFDQATEFVIDRDPNPHLAFGSGIHNCLGATLARLEGEIAVRSMVAHIAKITLVEHDPVKLTQLGGPDKLLVNIEAVRDI